MSIRDETDFEFEYNLANAAIQEALDIIYKYSQIDGEHHHD